MSYPGRPPIVQGLAMAPGMAYMPMPGPPQPLMPAVMPIQHVSYVGIFQCGVRCFKF